MAVASSSIEVRHVEDSNQVVHLLMVSGNESPCEQTRTKSTCMTMTSGSDPWNQGATIPFHGKRPWLAEGVGNGEGCQKRRRVCIKPLLWSAVEHMDSQAVQSLIQLKHDCCARYQGWTCLMKAAEDGNEPIMTQLLLEDVDVNAVNKKGRTAMSFAASPSFNRPSNIGALNLLLHCGADTSCLDFQFYSADSRALKEDRWAAVNLFKSHREGYTQSPSNRGSCHDV